MSNYLAIATVTAALQYLMAEHVRPDLKTVTITTQRPEAPKGDVSGPSINIYMYQATPNQAWRNKDLRTRRPKGDLIKHGLAALDLGYIFTFYGNETLLEPQRLLGSAVRTLVDYPLLTPDIIRNGVRRSKIPGLEEATLDEQVQQVRFIPDNMTTEDLSRIWSTFVQEPYALSFAYMATAILIQGKKAGRASLPVRRRMASVSQNRPVIERVEPVEIEQPITLSSSVVIRGRQLVGSSRTEVRIGDTYIQPRLGKAQDAQVLLEFSTLGDKETSALRPGVQALQVVQTASPMSNSVWQPVVESNVIPIVLCPIIVGGNAGIEASNVEMDYDTNGFAGSIFITLDLTVGYKQRAFLLLNRISGSGSETYIFRTARREADTRRLEFSIERVVEGDFLVRVQIDGAESPLLDDDEQYVGPTISIR
ncbi:MAG: DUF4255 domain-containing protein [Cyanobacteria bacterium J06598_1]